MDWNDERTAALKQMWLEGMSASQVARQLGGVSRNAVIGKVHRLGLNSREVPSRPRSLGGRPAGPARARTTVVQARRVTPTSTPRPAPVRAPIRVFDPDVGPTASLLTLSPEGCRWPIGDPAEADFGFCGRERGGSGSYCEGHGQAALRRRRSPSAISAEVEYWVQQSNGSGRRPAPRLPGR